MTNSPQHGWPQLFQLITLTSFLIKFACGEADPIIIKGNRLFYATNGSEFLVKGIVYDSPPSPSNNRPDLLSEKTVCERDVQYFKQLKINVLEVNYFNPRLDHTACMRILSDAGIYVLASMSKDYISDWANQGWTVDAFNPFRDFIDNVASYKNILGLVGPRSHLNSVASSRGFPQMKAQVRDIKDYMREKKYRAIPIGIRSGDLNKNTTAAYQQFRDLSVDYWSCNSSLPDFLTPATWGAFEYCGGEDTLEKMFSSYSDIPIPIIVRPQPCESRVVSHVEQLFERNQYSRFSGAILTEYFERPLNATANSNPIGLMRANSVTGQLAAVVEFHALSSKFATLIPKTMSIAQMPTSTAALTCPTPSGDWKASNILPPKPYQKLCSCMMDTLRCITTSETIEWLDVPSHNITHTYASINEFCRNGNDCAGLGQNQTTGTYGAFSMCNSSDSYSFAMNGYWKRHGTCLSPIGMNNVAMLRDLPKTTDPDCPFLLKQVGEDGLGTLTATPNAAINTSPPEGTGTFGTNTPNNINKSGGPVNGSTGLSFKTKLGIGIGVAVSTTLGLLLLLFLLNLKRKRAQLNQSETQEDTHQRKELDGRPIDGPCPFVEAPDRDVYAVELHADCLALEIDSKEPEIK
ncbi:Glucanosyltransferase-domain-containing protein [Dendryphion nanum]|uniref:1,3-beta-glucanosyltransferase n=1 Tax=Dendryphion nanum TaxID=256645 RepID=A0A9P9DU39_9PLEO|nr:Glucanosyltransferase-domain-containing protein [Dendryphion nanum]